MRRKIEVGTRHLYAMYRKNNKFDKDFPPVDFNTYRKVLNRFGENFIHKIIGHREGVDFPNDRGHLMITKNKSSTKPKLLKDGSYLPLGYMAKHYDIRGEDGFVVPNMNDHSDGYKFRWNWVRRKSKVMHQQLISLDIMRKWDRYLAKSIFAGKQDYYNS